MVGDQVLCGGRFGRVESLDLRTGSTTTARYDMQRGPVADLVLTPDGRMLAELAATQPVIARWRLDGTGPITRLLPATGTPTGYDASGRLLLTSGPFQVFDCCGYSHPVKRVVDGRTGALLWRDDHKAYAPTWTGRRGQLATWNAEDQGHVIDVRTGKPGLALESGLGGAAGGWMSAGGARLLGWSDTRGGGTAAWVMWDLRTGGEIGTGAFAGTSASTSRSGRLVVWSDGSQLQTVRASDRHVLARSGGIVAGAVSPAGVVAASGADGSLIFLDVHTLRADGRPLPDAPGIIEQFAFSRDGRLLAVRSPDGTVRLIDMASRTQLGEPIVVNGDDDPTVALRPDGRALAQPSPNGVLVWDLRPAHWQAAACQLAGRDLTREEWQTYLSAVGSYKRACPAAS